MGKDMEEQKITGRRLVAVSLKPYTTQVDGKPYEVRGEKWTGLIIPENTERYFVGTVWDLDENDNYSGGDSVWASRSELWDRAERVTFL